ncbi:hypothetical protein MKY15_20535 [Sporosarcina sp. FSL K6-1540]|uniref:hypothetical protein n=1 Tax=Sporosarcina sp. FSL K6-1540 TaxID=2921555 RepID=UPI00315AC204
MKILYTIIAIMAFSGGCASIYRLTMIPPEDSNFLTVLGLLIACLSLLLAVSALYNVIVEKERDNVELGRLTNAISTLETSIKETNKEIEKIDNKINNYNSEYHSTNQNNIYSLLTIDLNSKKDLKRK